MKIAIIGAGNMGGAIARGLAKGDIFRPENIAVADPSTEKLEELKNEVQGIVTSTTNACIVKDADFVVVAVKPWLVVKVFEEILPVLDFSKQTILSVAAGVSFADISEMIKTEDAKLVRVIPNTAISILESMTILSVKNLTTLEADFIKKIFDELGQSTIVEERLMGAATALCSCGIAYAFRYIKAATDGGVEMGFYPHQAVDMITQTVKGAIGLLEKNGSMPDEEIYKVTTPGGITIKGLNEMEAQGFTNSVIKGLKASMK